MADIRFAANREQILNIRQLIEKCREHNINAALCFIDYAKAFDCINWSKMFRVMQEMGVPQHLIFLVQNLYLNRKSRYDKDNDGKISYVELKDIIESREYDHDLPNNVVDKIMAVVDRDNSRYMDFQFLGKWYEIERFPIWYEEYGACAYKFINQCGRRIEIEHGFVKNDIQYILHVNSSYSPGEDAIFEIKKNNIDPVGIPLSVITTDYSNYAIVYGCKNANLAGIKVKYIIAWIFSRQPTIPEEILEQAHRELNSVPHAYVAYLQTVPQSEQHCSYSWTAHVNAEENEIEVDDDDFIEYD